MPDAVVWGYHNPVRIEYGPLGSLRKYVNEKHVLVVTTPGFVKRGLVEQIKSILAPHKVTVWDGVKPNPDLKDLDIATHHLQSLDISCVLGLGGGSALDAAKVLATTIPNPSKPTLAKVFRDNVLTQWARRLPLVVIPTTSGTGAEVTPFATIWDYELQKKYSLTGDFIFPDLALLDANLTLTLMEEDTLYPALDAVSHALESLWNIKCTPITRAFALNALNLSAQSLPVVLENPQNLLARRDLMVASALAGLAISQTRTAIAHAISYPLTLHCRVPHGLACSFPLMDLLAIHTDRIATSPSELKLLGDIKFILKKLNLQNRIQKYIKNTNIQSLYLSLDESRARNYLGDSSKVVEACVMQLSAIADHRG